MKTTEQFEAWWNSAYADSYDKSTVGYVLAKSMAWTAWQASRAAIEIEIPEVCAWNLCELLDKKEVLEALRAAGIKVKE